MSRLTDEQIARSFHQAGFRPGSTKPAQDGYGASPRPSLSRAQRDPYCVEMAAERSRLRSPSPRARNTEFVCSPTQEMNRTRDLRGPADLKREVRQDEGAGSTAEGLVQPSLAEYHASVSECIPCAPVVRCTGVCAYVERDPESGDYGVRCRHQCMFPDGHVARHLCGCASHIEGGAAPAGKSQSSTAGGDLPAAGAPQTLDPGSSAQVPAREPNVEPKDATGADAEMDADLRMQQEDDAAAERRTQAPPSPQIPPIGPVIIEEGHPSPYVVALPWLSSEAVRLLGQKGVQMEELLPRAQLPKNSKKRA